jgi:hypothetical protein
MGWIGSAHIAELVALWACCQACTIHAQQVSAAYCRVESWAA